MHRLLLGLLAALVLATPASAATVTRNACVYEYDGFPRDTQVELGGTLAPVAVGQPAALTGATVRAIIPESVIQSGYDLGILSEGDNRIPTRVWVALGARGAEPAVRVLPLRVVATARIENGRARELDVTVPLPDTTWTVTAPTVELFQAGPGTLGELPVGTLDAPRAVTGSVYIAARLRDAIAINIDCQPGRQTARGEKAIVPAAALPFATGIEGQAPAAGDGTGIRRARLRVGAVRAVDGALRLRLTCRTATPCAGRLTLRAGDRTVARGRYRVGSQRTRTVRLRRLAPGRRVTVVATVGATAEPAQRRRVR